MLILYTINLIKGISSPYWVGMSNIYVNIGHRLEVAMEDMGYSFSFSFLLNSFEQAFFIFDMTYQYATWVRV